MRRQGLGTVGDWGGIIQAGAGLISTFVGSKQADQNNASAERQMQLQVQALQAQQANQSALMKTVLIGVGGVIVLGTVAYIVTR